MLMNLKMIKLSEILIVSLRHVYAFRRRSEEIWCWLGRFGRVWVSFGFGFGFGRLPIVSARTLC